MNTEDVRTLLSILAFGTSIASLVLTSINWKQSNRPIVSAYVVDDGIGINVALFNLSVANTGTRPATDIRIYFDRGELEKLIDPAANAEAKMELASCFSRDSKIPLLRNGEVLTGALGHSSSDTTTIPKLLYGAEATVLIKYGDLEGKKFSSRQPIKIYARNGFTGSSWISAA